ncbi:MAG: zf-TFIIB domain-containing protein [Acidobacteriota bacterium]
MRDTIDAHAPPPASCPGCGHPLDTRTVSAHYGRHVTIDVCPACHGFWFDHLEQVQLSPGATLRLFRELSTSEPTAGPERARKPCPRCGARLQPTRDRREATDYVSDRCPKGCGRFMTFAAFLRAKHFVRDLTPAEIARLRDHLQFARCPGCGANVEIRVNAACTYCKAPLAILDPDQLQKALDTLRGAELRANYVDTRWPLAAAAVTRATERALEGAPSEAELLDVSVAGFGRLLARLGLTRER